MSRIPLILAGAVALATLAHAQPPASPASAKTVLDRQLSMIERELIPLVEAMPADKMAFAPTGGEFKNVRTFAQQATHVGAVIYVVAAAILGEKNPTDMGTNENGPASIKTKDQVVQYLKESFAYGHKALGTITDQNLMSEIQSPFGQGKTTRLNAATIPVWHSFDHYGQMVVYARMNGVVPPASRQ